MTTVARSVGPSQKGELGRTLTARAALLRPHDRLGAAGNRAGYQHAHLPPRVAVAVAAAVVPAVALLVSPSVRGEAEAGRRCWSGGARNLGAFCTHRKDRKVMGLLKDTGPWGTSGWKVQSIYDLPFSSVGAKWFQFCLKECLLTFYSIFVQLSSIKVTVHTKNQLNGCLFRVGAARSRSHLSFWQTGNA